MTTTALFFYGTLRAAEVRRAVLGQTRRLISCIGQSLAAMKSDVLTVLFILCWWLVLGSGERAAGNRTQGLQLANRISLKVLITAASALR